MTSDKTIDLNEGFEREARVRTDRWHSRDVVVAAGGLRKAGQQADSEVQVGDVHRRGGGVTVEVWRKRSTGDKRRGRHPTFEVDSLSAPIHNQCNHPARDR